jgi:hypothetical protein
VTQKNGTHQVSATVTGLTPGTTYHFRIVATSAGYALPVDGSDMTFTTAASGGKHGANSVTITATRAVTFGRPARVSGRVSGSGKSGVQVKLEADPYPYTGGFKDTGLTTTTNARGGYSINVTPTVNTRYVVIAQTAPPVTSVQTAVRVRVRVALSLSTLRPAVGRRVRFHGTVTPAHNGRFANIQRRTRTGRWRTVARTRLVAAAPVNGTAVSEYSTRLRIRHDGTYRVRVNPHDGDHVTGNSRAFTVRVH